MNAYQPKTGAKCGCKRGLQRDNCPTCEGTGEVIDFAAIRARRTQPTIQDAMADLLDALGFAAMAREVRTEQDTDRLKHYARVCVKNAPPDKARAMANLFRMHKPPLF